MSKLLTKTPGTLFLIRADGNETNLGASTVEVTAGTSWDYSLVVYDGKGARLFTQPLDTSASLAFRPAKTVEWVLQRPNSDPVLLKFTVTGDDAEFRSSVARGLLESAYKASLDKAVSAEDRDWVAAGATGGMSMNDDDAPVSQYQHRAGTRVAAPADDFDDDDDDDAHNDDDDDDDGYEGTAAPRTPQKIRTGGASSSPYGDDDGITRSARKGKISTLVAGTSRAVAFAACGDQLGMFRHTQDGDLEYMNRVKEVKGKDGSVFTPGKLQLHNADTQLLMLDTGDRDKIYNVDIETGKVVDEWAGRDGAAIQGLAPRTKYAQTTNENLVVGVSDNAIFSIDPRIAQRNKIAEECAYATKVNLRNAATTEDGYLAVGSETGEIRLFNKLQKNYCKTVLPGLGNAITHVCVTADGQWLLATTKTYLIVMNLAIDYKGETRTGFDVRMGAQKPDPIKLSLLPADLVKYGIKEVNFSPAQFNTGTLANSKEKWIASSTGRWVITWDFDKVKLGQKFAYTIRKSDEAVVMDVFRHNHANELLVAEHNTVYTSHIQAKK